MEKIKVNISWSGDNYCAGIEYEGMVVVTNKSLEKLYNEASEAFNFHLKGLDNKNADNFEFEYIYEVSALIHRLEGIVSLAAISRATGINERQIWHYASGLHNPRPAQREKIIEGIHSIGEQLISVV